MVGCGFYCVEARLAYRSQDSLSHDLPPAYKIQTCLDVTLCTYMLVSRLTSVRNCILDGLLFSFSASALAFVQQTIYSHTFIPQILALSYFNH